MFTVHNTSSQYHHKDSGESKAICVQGDKAKNNIQCPFLRSVTLNKVKSANSLGMHRAHDTGNLKYIFGKVYSG